jgi:4-hydroxybenzoate polyprenyltransferase
MQNSNKVTNHPFSVKGHTVDYLRLMRIQVAGGMALPLIYGAISVNNLSFSVIGPLLIIGILSGIYGFVLNDYIDINVDKLSKDLSERVLVKGTVSKKSAVAIIILCFVFAYATVFIFFYRNHILFFMGLSVLIVAEVFAFIYNSYGKRIIGSDFLLALAQSLYFLFAALMSLKDGNPGMLTWVIFILVFNQLLFMNAISGGLKDADHDYLMNVKNIALASGVKVTKDKKVIIPFSFKAFGMLIRFFSAFLIFVPFVFYQMNYEIWQMILLIILVFILLYASFSMLNIKIFDRNKLRKILVIQLFMWYSILPIMLVSIIGLLYAFILIIFPFAWYIIFSIIIGEKPMEPNI